jgi:flagellar hook-associated protein 1 FlgK
MTNFGAKIINNAISGLQAQQAQIANLSNNIANVNTPGYSRRVVELENRASPVGGSGITIGDGVNVASVLRVADSFLDAAVRTSMGEKAAAEMSNEFLSRVEKLFTLSDTSNSIGDNLTKFYSSFNDLAANPGSIELRTNVIEAARNLTSAISSTYNALANIQKEADSRVEAEVNTINSITTKIAALNEQIRSREGANGSGTAADERDQREVLLQELSGKISFEQVEVADGSVTLSLSNGFTIVSAGISRQLSVTDNPSFAGATIAPSLSGGVLKYVVFDYNSGAGTSHINLTSEIAQGQGSLAALLDIRGVSAPSDTTAFQALGTIPDIARRIESISRTLLTEFNTVYLGPDRDAAANYQASSGDLNGNVPATFGIFDFTFGGAKDVDGDGQPEIADLDALIAAGSVDNFSSILTVAFSDPRRVAAGRDVGTGSPAANVFSPGDNQNALAMAALQNRVISSMSLGPLTATNITVADFYNQTVGQVGNLKVAAEMTKNVSTQNLISAQNRRDSMSAVSLDEEYSNLTIYQQAYQASARMIRVADSIFQEVLGFIG